MPGLLYILIAAALGVFIVSHVAETPRQRRIGYAVVVVAAIVLAIRFWPLWP